MNLWKDKSKILEVERLSTVQISPKMAEIKRKITFLTDQKKYTLLMCNRSPIGPKNQLSDSLPYTKEEFSLKDEPITLTELHCLMTKGYNRFRYNKSFLPDYENSKTGYISFQTLEVLEFFSWFQDEVLRIEKENQPNSKESTFEQMNEIFHIEIDSITGDNGPGDDLLGTFPSSFIPAYPLYRNNYFNARFNGEIISCVYIKERNRNLFYQQNEELLKKDQSELFVQLFTEQIDSDYLAVYRSDAFQQFIEDQLSRGKEHEN